jgi:hypothetical protein
MTPGRSCLQVNKIQTQYARLYSGAFMKRKLTIPSTIRLLLLSAVFSVHGFTAFAQQSDSMKSELRKIGKLMCDEKNQNFIIIDGLADGLIQAGVHYDIRYNNGPLLINEKVPPPEILSRYHADLLLFFDETNAFGETNSRDSHTFSLMGSITLKEIFNANSGFRKPFQLENEFIRGMLVEVLVKDKKLDTSKDYSIIYDANGLYLNNELLSKKDAAKYIQMINTLGFTPTSSRAELRFTHSAAH